MADGASKLPGKAQAQRGWDRVITPEDAKREGIKVIHDWDNDGLPDNDPQVKARKKQAAQAAVAAINDCSGKSIRHAYINYMRLTQNRQADSISKVARLFNMDADSVTAVLRNEIK